MLCSTAWSACEQADLAGKWWVTAPDYDVDEAESAVCALKFGSDGQVEPSTACTYTRSEGVKVRFIRGQVKLGKNCLGNGTIVARSTARNGAVVEESFRIRKLILGRGKDVAVLLVNEVGDPDSDGAVTMVKQFDSQDDNL
jgi:hypothetical protein